MVVTQVLFYPPIELRRYYYTSRILPSWACLFSAVSHPHLDTSDSLTTPTLHCFPVAIWFAVSRLIPSSPVSWPMQWMWYEKCICNKMCCYMPLLPLLVGDGWRKASCHTATLHTFVMPHSMTTSLQSFSFWPIIWLLLTVVVCCCLLLTFRRKACDGINMCNRTIVVLCIIASSNIWTPGEP